MMLFFENLIASYLVILLLALSFMGWGYQAIRLSLGEPEIAAPFDLIWVGWAVSLTIFLLLNFLLPLSWGTNIAVPAIGIILFLISWKRKSPKVFADSIKFKYFAIPLILILSTVIVIRAMGIPDLYDSGLYHFNSIRWINEYRAIPGLVNLHGRLAFNQTFFIFVASLNLPGYFNNGHNIGNAFLTVILFGECLFPAIKCAFDATKREKIGVAEVIPAFFLPFIWAQVVLGPISSPSPDFASNMLRIVIFLRLIRAIENRTKGINDKCAIFIIIFISATCVTLKLTNIFFSLTSILIALALHFWRNDESDGVFKTLGLARISALPAAIVILWLIKGAILSGWPLYPSTLLVVRTDYTASVEQVENEMCWIKSWARAPNQPCNEVLENWDWFKPWTVRMKSHFPDIIWPAVSTAVMLLIYLAKILFADKNRLINKFDLLVLLPPIISVVCWFLTAPDPRFAGSSFAIMPVAVVFMLLRRFEPLAARDKLPILLALFVFANWGYSKTLMEYGIVNPTQIHLSGYAPVPKIEMIEKTTDSGLHIYVPKVGDQCWDSILPCTPYFNPKLKLRGADITSGFTLNEPGEYRR